MSHLIERLRALTARKSRFTYDLRGDSFVDQGSIAAYKATQFKDHFTDLPEVVEHALEHDGIVGAWKDPADGRVYYDSCRLFTDSDSALRFARTQRQRSVFNLNRMQEILVKGS